MRTTVGQLLINDALPEELRDYTRKIDKKSIKKILGIVAEKYPQRYNEVASAFMKLGGEVSTTYGRESSLNLDALKIGPNTRKLRDALNDTVQAILETPGLSHDERDARIVKAVGRAASKIRDTNFKEQVNAGNALAKQVQSGARGNQTQFSGVNVGDLLVQDHRDNPIPVAMTNSYAEGLDPVEYWAGSYGARKGMVDLKFATPKGGFLGKQLSLASHRLVVTEEDCGTANGIPVDADDPDNVGSLLARGYGNVNQGTTITPKLVKGLKKYKTIVVRSPLTCQAKDGVCAKCAGVREKGNLPDIGDNIGIAAAQAISEPISQSAMSSKHSGGTVGIGPTASGFDAINQLTQVPKTFKGGAAVANLDGRVDSIEKAPQGGTFVTVAGERHYVLPDFQPLVKIGDKVEAGDVISEGLPNPAEIVRHKGVGAGRWHFMRNFRDTLKASRIGANRRNIELLSRGLINHVRIVEPDGPPDTLPDDVVEFNSITRGYTPRRGSRTVDPKRAKGMYLEAPALQYSVGTRVTPRVIESLKRHGVSSVVAHGDKPSFAPEMVRAMETIAYAPDWMTRLGGFHLKKGLLSSVHRGVGAKEHGTSFIPSLVKGTEFGKPPAGSGAVY
jgi:DNA-directed RNA polymerase subunit beta'